jgi:hypothetical protein
LGKKKGKNKHVKKKTKAKKKKKPAATVNIPYVLKVFYIIFNNIKKNMVLKLSYGKQ